MYRAYWNKTNEMFYLELVEANLIELKDWKLLNMMLFNMLKKITMKDKIHVQIYITSVYVYTHL